MNINIKELLNTVVENDYCIGCGICASLQGSPLTMKLDGNGKFKPFINEGLEASAMEINALTVCPFSNENKDETEIGKDIFSEHENIDFNEYTGYTLRNYAGYVKEGEYRKKGSSGGMGSWIATQLLKRNLVDGIIHVKGTHEDSELMFEYQMSFDENELLRGAKSKYYPIELSQVMKLVKSNKGRYAIIGIPCYIKSVRLLAEQDEIIKDRVKFFIGLVCGHLKSEMFAKSMGWQLGIKPQNLKRIDFRKKLENKAANNYGIEVTGEKNGKQVVIESPTKELYTTNWGHGLFKYNACEFCDDVLAETADVTIGDAWLPEYSNDSMGTNIITVRNPEILKILESNEENIHIEEISNAKIYQSQAGGFRHRRDGLAYRLYLKDEGNEWRPNKRVNPTDKISLKRKHIYEERSKISKESFKAYKIAFNGQDFDIFIKYMNPKIKHYERLANPSILGKIRNRSKKILIKLKYGK